MAPADAEGMTTTSALLIPRPDMLPRAVPRPAVVARVRTIDAFVAISAGGGFAGWALQVGADDPVSGRLRGGIADAAEAVLGRLAQLAQVEDLWIALHCATALVLERAAAIAGLEAYPIGMARRHPARFEVARAASAQLDRALATAPRLLVAVDGSWGRALRGGGWAFLASDATYRSSSGLGVRSSAEAELRAIRLALMTTPAQRSVTIRTDSRLALAWLQEPGRAKPALRSEVFGILALLEGRDVAFEWVRGHVCPGLHDGADRLAVAARRAREAGLGATAPAEVAGRIVAESLAAHRDGSAAHARHSVVAGDERGRVGLAA